MSYFVFPTKRFWSCGGFTMKFVIRKLIQHWQSFQKFSKFNSDTLHFRSDTLQINWKWAALVLLTPHLIFLFIAFQIQSKKKPDK